MSKQDEHNNYREPKPCEHGAIGDCPYCLCLEETRKTVDALHDKLRCPCFKCVAWRHNQKLAAGKLDECDCGHCGDRRDREKAKLETPAQTEFRRVAGHESTSWDWVEKQAMKLFPDTWRQELDAAIAARKKDREFDEGPWRVMKQLEADGTNLSERSLAAKIARSPHLESFEKWAEFRNSKGAPEWTNVQLVDWMHAALVSLDKDNELRTPSQPVLAELYRRAGDADVATSETSDLNDRVAFLNRAQAEQREAKLTESDISLDGATNTQLVGWLEQRFGASDIKILFQSLAIMKELRRRSELIDAADNIRALDPNLPWAELGIDDLFTEINQKGHELKELGRVIRTRLQTARAGITSAAQIKLKEAEK